MNRTLFAALVASLAAGPALAEGLMIKDAYARASRPNAPTGAAFMQILNHGETDDRLISVASDIAARVELHTHIDMGDGVLKMMEVEDGFALPAGGMVSLARGGDHVMFMGLNQSLIDGETISVTLTFEHAGDMIVDIPVDNVRMDKHGDHSEMDHSQHMHGSQDGS